MLTLLISPRVEDLSLSILLVFYFIVIVWYCISSSSLFLCIGWSPFSGCFPVSGFCSSLWFWPQGEKITRTLWQTQDWGRDFFQHFVLSQKKLGFPRPSEIPEKELKYLLMRALQPPIHNQPKMNVGWVVPSFKNTFIILSDVKHCLVNICRMEPMIQNWIPLKKRWINVGAHGKHR